MPSRRRITSLLKDLKAGDRRALDELMPVVYEELRSLAARHLRKERRDHTLQTTALVHEVYLRLVDQKEASWTDRAHFFAFAATLIRRILVDHARRHGAEKRGGKRQRVPLDEEAAVLQQKSIDLIGLDEALNGLAKTDRRKCRVVELRYFGGLSVEETAEVLGVSPSTVERDWNMARAWIYREMEEGRCGGS